MVTPLPVDLRLPHLARALDPEAVHALFAAELPPGRLSRIAVERVKYRPGRNVAVAYALTLDDGAVQRVATRWCHGGDAARRAAKAAPHTPSPAGPSVTHHAALDMVAHWWPNDAKLAASRALNAPAMARVWLPELLRTAGETAPLAEHALSLVQLVPEHRMTVRATLGLAGSRRFTAYAKADAEGRGPRTHAVMQALWDAPAQRDGRLRTPRPWLWQPRSGLHWQQALPGRDLLDHGDAVDASDAAGVGAMLAALHATPTPAPPVDDPTARLAAVASSLAALLPARAAALRRVASALETLPPTSIVTLHGDLHPRNLLRDEAGTLRLIDLDSARTGPALLDLGAWCADALYRAQLGGRAPASVLPALRAFVAGYGTVAARDLAWATAYQLLCQRAWRCAVNLKPGRWPLIGPLVDLASRLLAAGDLGAVADAPRCAP